MGTWIDFRALRAQLSFGAVLQHYKVEVKKKGNDQHHGYCPLPKHEGKRNSPSFSANLAKGIFHCFGCGAKGNLIDFAALMEGLDPKNGADVRTVALKLQERFCPAAPKASKSKKHQADQPELPKIKEQEEAKKAIVNAPLDFELKHLDPNHPYLDKRGFSKETIAHFGLGYCSKGLLSGRIAIPLHDHGGQLIGYAGRIVDDAKINADNPRYKFPPPRERNGMTYEFHKLLMLYNSHRLTFPVESLLIVEGFPSVWWLTQMQLPNVVGLMGWAMSAEQAKIVTDLVSPSGHVWIIPDGNEAGVKCAHSVFEHLGTSRFIQWLKLEEGKQPTDYPGGWLRERLR